MLFFFTGKLSFWEAMLANMSPKTITTSRCDTLEAIAAALRSDKLEFGLSFDIRRNGLFGLLFSDTKIHLSQFCTMGYQLISAVVENHTCRF